MLSPPAYDSLELQRQYGDVNNRWDGAEEEEEEGDHEGSSARRFERSRIKALAGTGKGGHTRHPQKLGGWVGVGTRTVPAKAAGEKGKNRGERPKMGKGMTWGGGTPRAGGSASE